MFVALAGLFLIWKSNSTGPMDGVSLEPSPKREKTNPKTQPQKDQTVTPYSSKAPMAQREPQEDQNLPQDSYENAVAELTNMIAQFPQSRLQLIQFINRGDVFKEKGMEVKPHSLSEINQMKMGAVKVMALRELMKSEKNTRQLSLDLHQVAQSAQDPTIRSIAEAAEESLSKGRSFFDDFLDGIDRLPITN